jgi:hypothetical protein
VLNFENKKEKIQKIPLFNTFEGAEIFALYSILYLIFGKGRRR